MIGEDNAVSITAIRKGYSPALRHMLRQQRCALGQLHELITELTPEGVGEFVLEHQEMTLTRVMSLPSLCHLPGTSRQLNDAVCVVLGCRCLIKRATQFLSISVWDLGRGTSPTVQADTLLKAEPSAPLMKPARQSMGQARTRVRPHGNADLAYSAPVRSLPALP